MAPFTDALLRLKRANALFNSLKDDMRRWLERRTYEISITRNADTGETVAEVDEAEPIPSDISLIATEIVQHFRASLDNAVHALRYCQLLWTVELN